MIIRVDVEPEYANTLTDAELTSLGDILRCHREGIHLVIVQRAFAEAILAKQVLALDQRATLSKLSREYTQSANLTQRCGRFLSVQGGGLMPKVTLENMVSVGLAALSQTRILERPLLVVENIHSDGTLMSDVLNWLCKAEGLPNISWDCDHGGGDDLPKVVAIRVQERRVISTVVDSDRHSPHDRGNEKLSSIERLTRAANWPFLSTMCLPCLEAENVIPLQAFLELDGVKPQDLEIILRISDAEDQIDCPLRDRFWLFFDVKKGLNPEAFSKHSTQTQAWLRGKLHLAHVLPENTRIAGHGNNVTSRLKACGGAMSRFHRSIRAAHWQGVFYDAFVPSLWTFAAARRQFI